MLPIGMNLNINSGTVGYNNKILISDGMFSLGKNDNSSELRLGSKMSLFHCAKNGFSAP